MPCSIPWALMSSSISGQCTPCPEPIISKRWRCWLVAFIRRHDHAKGTVMVRPSLRWADIVSSSTHNDKIRGSLFTAVFIPCLQKKPQIFSNDSGYAIQLLRGESIIRREFHGFQPIFTNHSFALHMHVLRFSAIETVKIYPIGSRNSANCRHCLPTRIADPTRKLYAAATLTKFIIECGVLPIKNAQSQGRLTIVACVLLTPARSPATGSACPSPRIRAG